jgi:hypothetical protein
MLPVVAEGTHRHRFPMAGRIRESMMSKHSSAISLAGPARAVVTLLLAAIAIAGCATPVTVKGDWIEGAARPQAFKKLLVVGLSPDFNIRCSFEWMLVPHLREGGAQPSSSCSQMKPEEQLSREAIERLVVAMGADGVLVTRLVASQSGAKESGSRDTRGSARYKPVDQAFDNTYWGGYYGMPTVYVEFQTQRSILSLERTVVIESALFEARTARPVYSVQTTARNQQSRDQLLGEVSPSIASQLRKAGLIP